MSTAADAKPARIPEWMRRPIRTDKAYAQTHEALKKNGLNTVCEDAKCPNRHECWNHGTATIMILGNVCTRDCRFCSVATGKPDGLDAGEPMRVADAVEKMKLKHVVLTRVTRDDLPDGGADIFAQTILAIRERTPGVAVEVLTPDFWGREENIRKVLDAGPSVFSHNVETVRRLQRSIRSGATYARSLKVLEYAAGYAASTAKVKTGIMLGLGETNDEVFECLRDIFQSGVRLLTIGQYMAPPREHARTKRFATPKEFAELEAAALEMGFEAVASGPLVRSSYRAERMVRA